MHDSQRPRAGQGSRQGLTYLLVSRCNGNQVHVVETHHVDDPHLLVVERRNLVKLTRGKAEKTWRLTQESTPGTQGSREPSASTQGPGKDLV